MGRVFSAPLISGLVIVCLLVLLPQTTEMQTDSGMESNQLGRTNLLSYTPHGPITISDDIDFESQGWPGNGTKTDPYVIEGLNITVTSTGISISDTRVYFEIRNCVVISSSPSGNPGIYLYNSTYGVIEDCIVDSHSIGIHVYRSHHCMLINNTASNSQDHGFHVSFSENCTLIGNEANNNSWNGIKLSSAFNTTMIGNTAFNNSVDGFNLEGSSVNCALLDNEAINNSQHGFYFYHSHFTIMVNNSAVGNSDAGFYADYAYYSEFMHNTVSNNEHGVVLIRSDHCNFSYNTALDNDHYGFFFRSPSLTIINNTAVDNGDTGITVYDSNGCKLINNTALRNSKGFGVSGDFNEIFQNTALNNSRSFVFSGTDGNVSQNSAINSNSIGFAFSPAADFVVTNNIAITPWSYAESFGIYNSVRCNLSNNYASSGIIGFDVYQSNDTIIENNTIINHSNYGFLLYRSMNNTICNNTITGNTIYGAYLNVDSEDNLLYLNRFASNGDGNARDDGIFNNWDNGTHGNYWSDYSGSGVYDIPGTASSVDHYPFVYLYTPPELSHPTDIEYIVGATGHTISWMANGSHPATYQIFRDDVIIRSGTWNSSSEVITISVDGLDIGIYVYRIEIVDTLDVGVGDLVTVTVVESASTTSTSTTTESPTSPTSGPTGGYFDQTMTIIIGGATIVVLVITFLAIKKKTE